MDSLHKNESITLPETNSSHLKMDGWNTRPFPFGKPYFQVRIVSFREGMATHCEPGFWQPPRDSQHIKLFRYPNLDDFITGTRSVLVPPTKKKPTKNRHKILLKGTSKQKESLIKLPKSNCLDNLPLKENVARLCKFCYKPPTLVFSNQKTKERNPTCFIFSPRHTAQVVGKISPSSLRSPKDLGVGFC